MTLQGSPAMPILARMCCAELDASMSIWM